LEKFGKYISSEATLLIKKIKKSANIIDNEVTRIKINEVVSQLQHIETKSSVKDNYITALLIAYEISHELDSLS
jgi:hypothetical protein